MRATADLRMALAPQYEETERATAATAAGDVWCAYCPERATVEARLTTGETRAYCRTHITRLTIVTPLNRIEKTWSEL